MASVVNGYSKQIAPLTPLNPYTMTILLYWLIGMIVALALYLAAVTDGIKNFGYRVAGIIDCLKDFGVQVWLDVSRLWKFNRRLRGLNEVTDEFDMYD